MKYTYFFILSILEFKLHEYFFNLISRNENLHAKAILLRSQLIFIINKGLLQNQSEIVAELKQ